MTAGPLREDGSGLRARSLLERRVSRRALLTLSLAPGAAGEAALGHEQPRPILCGACGGYHGLAAVCPVEARQRAIARGFGRTPTAANPAPEFAANESEGGS